MNVDITNHLIPWTQVKRMLKRAWDEGHADGVDEGLNGERVLTNNPYDQEDE